MMYSLRSILLMATLLAVLTTKVSSSSFTSPFSSRQNLASLTLKNLPPTSPGLLGQVKSKRDSFAGCQEVDVELFRRECFSPVGPEHISHKADKNSSAPNGNVWVSDPPVTRPFSRPEGKCTTSLFDTNFTSYADIDYTFDMPQACADGPWSKIVLDVQCGVTAGRQYDRTLQIYLDDVHLLTGTTPEPDSDLGPTWNISADISRLAALFLTNPKSGMVNLGTVVSDTYNGVPHCSAEITFFMASPDYPAPTSELAPSHLVSLGYKSLSSDTAALSGSITFPRNTVSISLDVIVQGQGGDEFWWSCAPSSVSDALGTCGNSAFRLTRIYIDDTLVALLPIYPYLFTGGVDPLLWQPIPGVQTLQIQPLQADLTPFVPLVTDGLPHTVSLQILGDVTGVNSFWHVAGTIFYNIDPSSSHTTGTVKTSFETLLGTGLVPQIDIRNGTNGDVLVEVSYAAELRSVGQLTTSEGVIPISTVRNIAFSNIQNYRIKGDIFSGDLQAYYYSTFVQDASMSYKDEHSAMFISYPFEASMDIYASSLFPPKINQRSNFNLGYVRHNELSSKYDCTIANGVESTDTLVFDLKSLSLTSQDASSRQQYFFQDSHGNYWNRLSTSEDNLRVNQIDQGSNSLSWWVDAYNGLRVSPVKN